MSESGNQTSKSNQSVSLSEAHDVQSNLNVIQAPDVNCSTVEANANSDDNIEMTGSQEPLTEIEVVTPLGSKITMSVPVSKVSDAENANMALKRAYQHLEIVQININKERPYFYKQGANFIKWVEAVEEYILLYHFNDIITRMVYKRMYKTATEKDFKLFSFNYSNLNIMPDILPKQSIIEFSSKFAIIVEYIYIFTQCGLYDALQYNNIFEIRKELGEKIAKNLKVDVLNNESAYKSLKIFYCYQYADSLYYVDDVNKRVVELNDLLFGKTALEHLSRCGLGSYHVGELLGSEIERFAKKFSQMTPKELEICGTLIMSRVLINLLEDKYSGEMCKVLRKTLTKIMDDEKPLDKDSLLDIGKRVQRLEAEPVYNYHPGTLIKETSSKGLINESKSQPHQYRLMRVPTYRRAKRRGKKN